MIDGVKIKIANMNTIETLNSSEVCYIGTHATNTGEILNNPYTAQYKGLNFRLISQANNESILYIDGSLHRFYKKGGKNNDNFYYWQLINTLDEFSALIKKPLHECILENIEFGVNIECHTTAKKIIQSIISYGSRPMAEMNVKKIGLGKVCAKQNTDHEFKIYDKGRQSETEQTNLLRIEVKVKKMRFLKSYGIQTLSSLLSHERIGILGQMLADMWAKLVYYDGAIDETKLSTAEQLKLKDYQNPKFWENLSHKNRYRERINFDNLIAKYSCENQQEEIKNLILDKWKRLVNRKRKNAGRLHQLLQSTGSGKNGAFAQLECIVQTPQKPLQNDREILPQKINIEKRFCSVCGTDISILKSDSKFCSVKCRNKNNNQLRQKNIVMQRTTEAAQVRILKKLIKKGNYPALITKAASTGTTFDRTDTKSIKPLLYHDLRKITAIEIDVDNQKYVFTKNRAKELFRHISKRNMNFIK